MKCIQAVAFGASLLSICTEGLTLRKRQDGPARVLGVDIERRAVDPLKHDYQRLLRRASTVEASLDNKDTLYFANISVGTPAQTMRLHIDTGSSDLWVNTPKSDLCAESGTCTYTGTYSANSSSTYAYVASNFNISYVDGSGASGDYVTDTVNIGGTSITKQQFGIGYSSSSPEGILGIGYGNNEVWVQRNGLPAYSNLPASLATQGFVSSNAYSLWLNDLDASTGSILFGGVDTEKFEGQLATMPVQKNSGEYAEFLITMTGLSMGTKSIASAAALAVLLDSGTSLTYLPDDWTSSIYTSVGALYDSSQGAAFVPCTLSKNTTSLKFSFSGVDISVPMDELVVSLSDADGNPLKFSNGRDACLFGIAPAGTSTAVLGDTFLRSAYVVYDLANNEISLAQTTFNATISNVVEITSGATGVPFATSVSNPVAATAGVIPGSPLATANVALDSPESSAVHNGVIFSAWGGGFTVVAGAMAVGAFLL